MIFRHQEIQKVLEKVDVMCTFEFRKQCVIVELGAVVLLFTRGSHTIGRLLNMGFGLDDSRNRYMNRQMSTMRPTATKFTK